MEPEVPNGSEGGDTPDIDENGRDLKAASKDESGEGLPYAPSNWPNPGDNWGWRVGKRISLNGNYVDRYLYLPPRLLGSDSMSRNKRAFASKLAVARYLEANFPDIDIKEFFASFSWRVPAKGGPFAVHTKKRKHTISIPYEEDKEELASDFDPTGCKAGNKTCISLSENVEDSPISSCDICCTEPRFCRDCCCILCCKRVDSNCAGYSYVKCEAIVENGRICAHLAHINCALRSYMAGKVGGSIGLDAEYYCRRCDAKSDLVPHASKILRHCESSDSRDDVEKILRVGISILLNSERTQAKELLNRIELVMKKLDSGTCLDDAWKVEADSSTPSTDITQQENTAVEVEYSRDLNNASGRSDWLPETLKLEDEVNRVLQDLRHSQEVEYKLAEERLYDQKHCLSSLYQQLEIEKFELARHRSTNREYYSNAVSSRESHIKQQREKLEEMGQVAGGFGKTPRYVLEEHFGFEVDG